MTFGWPQISYAILLVLGTGMYLAKHGEKRTGEYNFWVAILSDVLVIWLLHEGGFW